MKLPLQITYRTRSDSPTVDALIRSRAERLERYCDSIVSCRVVVDAPHRRHLTGGNHYLVRIDLKVPGDEIAINRDTPEHRSYTDIRVAIREAFDQARRLLKDFVHRQRGFVKTHAVES